MTIIQPSVGRSHRPTLGKCDSEPSTLKKLDQTAPRDATLSELGWLGSFTQGSADGATLGWLISSFQDESGIPPQRPHSPDPHSPVAGRAPRPASVRANVCPAPGTVSCVRGFPRGRGKPPAGRGRSPSNCGVRVKRREHEETQIEHAGCFAARI